MADRTGQGIELSPRHPDGQAGLQVHSQDQSGLQVYYPPPGPGAYTDDGKGGLPWEKTTPTTAYTPGHHYSGYSTPPVVGHPYDQSPLMPVAPPAADDRRILGLKRRTFFILVASLAFVLVLGIGTGVGVGVAMSGKDSSPPAPPAAANTTTPTPTTRTLPVPVATSTTSPTELIQCPAANRTLYASQKDLGKRFLVLCGVDYHSAQGTRDLLSRDAETMAQCVDYCAENKDCVGAGWGYLQGRYVCWLKSLLGESHEAGAWCFAVLEEG